MAVGYIVLYHELVVRDDISKITKTWQVKIRKAIEVKLTHEPALYGKPLRRSLTGYYKLRVGDYRVVYKIREDTVAILMIAHRSIVYEAVDGRLV